MKHRIIKTLIVIIAILHIIEEWRIQLQSAPHEIEVGTRQDVPAQVNIPAHARKNGMNLKWSRRDDGPQYLGNGFLVLHHDGFDLSLL
jgi:hypothetical protein